MISDAAVGRTLVDFVVANPTRRDLVECAARQVVATTNGERRKETHYRDREAQTHFVPIAFET